MSVYAADAVVIGAGVIGCSVARALAHRGLSVVVVDRNAGPGLGSTSYSSAIVRFHYSTLAGVATAWEAHFAWLEWEDFLGGPDVDGAVARFWRTGALCLEAPTMDHAEVLRLFDRVGVPYEQVTPDDVRRRFPALDPGRHYPPTSPADDAFWADPEGEVGGYVTPDAGFVDDPAYAAHNLATAARRLGVRFRYGVPVRSVDGPDRVTGVTLADGTRLAAPVAVNVAGPASAQVNALAGIADDFSVHTRPLRAEVHSVPTPASYGGYQQPGVLVADLDLGTYFRGTPGGEVIVGGTEPDCDPLEYVADPDDYRTTVTREVYERQLYRAARRMPDLAVPNHPHGIAALYDATDDWVPIYDRTSRPGFYVAIGTSGNQFKNAPLVGDYLADVVEACENGHDHDAEPVRHHLPHCGLDLDLSAYSRRRQPIRTTHSVMG